MYFILAYPYSGVNTKDLYCFDNASDNLWLLYLKAYLSEEPPHRGGPSRLSVDFTVDGDYIDIVHNGDVELKVKPPK